MKRREWMLGALASPWAVVPSVTLAHHGWSSFDQDRPIYLEGRVVAVRWANPHAELDIEVPANLKLPADLAKLEIPAQTAPVDGRALLARAVVPTRLAITMVRFSTTSAFHPKIRRNTICRPMAS